MKPTTLSKLDWQDLLTSLSHHCQTEEARARVFQMQVGLPKEEILKRWDATQSLIQLINLGYSPRIGELTPIEPLIKALRLGRVLDGFELKIIHELLITSQRLILFMSDLGGKNPAILEMKENIVFCPLLLQQLSNSLDEKGELKDTASKTLEQIRGKMKSLALGAEAKLKEFLHSHAREAQYLQDQYFTKRLGRLVLPIRLDGRGRVSGTIIDTSVGAQTIFIEPTSIKVFNDGLIELSQLEKIEEMRILKQLSLAVLEKSEDLLKSYEGLIIMDYFTACAFFALDMKANRVSLVSKPTLSLKEAHHPILFLKNKKSSRSNNISLENYQKTLVISGPNAGGKSVILKTVGLIHAMASSGLLVPCHEESSLFLFENLYVELGDSQSLAESLSSFSGHLSHLKPILENATSKDLILLDELATGTEPAIGAAIAQAILENLHAKNCLTVVTTHFSSLKQLAAQDKSYRNGSMEYSPGGGSPTYKLVLDIPGQSYGLELAEKVGLPSFVIQRARDLKGGGDNAALENLLLELSEKRDELRANEKVLRERTQKVDQLKETLEGELKSFKEKKGESIHNLVSYYDKKLEKMYEDFYVLESQFKKILKISEEKSPKRSSDEMKELENIKEQTENQIAKLNQSIMAIGFERAEKKTDLPGLPFDMGKAKEGNQVYVVDLKKEGSIVDIIDAAGSKIEVAIGPLRVNVSAKDLRYLGSGAPKKDSKQKKMKSFFKDRKDRKSQNIDFKTTTNTLDVRGQRLDEALRSMWTFVDKALLRGEHCIYVVHGHGMDALKQGLRTALKEESPYSLSYKSAEQNEGGDGVTVVYFDS